MIYAILVTILGCVFRLIGSELILLPIHQQQIKPPIVMAVLINQTEYG